jgi:AraC-like DNA-binding protein
MRASESSIEANPPETNPAEANPQGATTPASKIAPLLRLAGELGVAVGPILRELGLGALDLGEVLEPGVRVPSDVYIALWEAIGRASPIEDFGLRYATSATLDTWGAVGHLATSCRNLGDACEALVRYSPIFHHNGGVSVEVRDGVAVFRPHCRRHAAGNRHLVEASLGAFAFWARRAFAEDFAPSEVWFEHPAPTSTATHDALFRCPLRFDAPDDALWFDAALLERPLRDPRPMLARMLQEVAERELARYAAPPLALQRRVADEIGRLLDAGDGGVPPIEVVAQRLGMSPRTLQRRLRDANTHYRQVVDETRRALAVSYLRTPSLTVDAVALRLGFLDTSSFYRAFRRWTGHSPGQVR